MSINLYESLSQQIKRVQDTMEEYQHTIYQARQAMKKMDAVGMFQLHEELKKINEEKI